MFCSVICWKIYKNVVVLLLLRQLAGLRLQLPVNPQQSAIFRTKTSNKTKKYNIAKTIMCSVLFHLYKYEYELNLEGGNMRVHKLPQNIYFTFLNLSPLSQLPPLSGISGDNAHPRLCFTSFWTNYLSPIQWKKNWVPETSTRSSIRTPRFTFLSFLWRITYIKPNLKHVHLPVIRIEK